MSAGLKSTINRNDVFISEELVKKYFTSPINGENFFLSSMKKRQFEKKSKEKRLVLFKKILFFGEIFFN